MEQIITNYLNGNLSKNERNQLKLWVKKDPKNLELFEERIRLHNYIIPLHFDSQKAFEKFHNQTHKKALQRRRRYKVLSIAASLAIFMSLGWIYHSTNMISTPENSISDIESGNGFKKIEITLPDGSKQTINKQSIHHLKSKKGQLIALKKEGLLDFSNQENHQIFTTPTQIDIPYGEKLKIKLSDGTLVWLNSGTRFRFPQVFGSSSKTRQVEVIGEAYFEVAQNKNVPFIVTTPSVNIKVLGTHFNVSSYINDFNTITTLMEGSVSLNKNSNTENPLIIKPNQQAVYQKTNSLFEIAEVNTSDFNAWTGNVLLVDNLTFLEIKRKLERKYNVTITSEIEHLWTTKYKGKFKDESLRETLETIALSSKFNFKIEGKHVRIF